MVVYLDAYIKYATSTQRDNSSFTTERALNVLSRSHLLFLLTSTPTPTASLFAYLHPFTVS